MPMYTYVCQDCNAEQVRYIPASEDKLQPPECNKCDGTLRWGGLDACHGKAAALHGAYDRQGRFYPGTFGHGTPLRKKRNIKIFGR